MSRPTAISPEEQEQIARRIGVLLLQAAPEDWQQITVEYRATGEYHDLLGEVATQQGGGEPWEPPEELLGIFEHLREGMYRPDVGTWLSALYIVEKPSSYRIDINFDTEPRWRRPLPRAAYVDELRRYPRAEENVPDWLREKLDGTAGSAPQDAPVEAAPAEAVQPAQPVQQQAAPEQLAETPTFRTAIVFDDVDDHGRPLVSARTPVHPDELAALSQYLESAPIVLASRDNEPDRLDSDRPNAIPGTWHTDGVWLWQGSVPYYLAQYGVPPQVELVEHIRAQNYTLTEIDDRTRDAATRELFERTQNGESQQSEARVPAPQDIDERAHRGEEFAEHTPVGDVESAQLPDSGAPDAIADTSGFAAAVDAPADADDENADGYVDESFASHQEPGFAEPDPSESGAAEAVAAQADPAESRRTDVETDADAGHDGAESPDTGNVLAQLHDKLTEFRVNSTDYRIGSHSTSARCLLQEGPDWIVTAGPTDRDGADVRFSHPEQAAAYLLGSLLLAGSATAAAPRDQAAPREPVDVHTATSAPEPIVESAQQPEAALPKRTRPDTAESDATPAETAQPQPSPQAASPQAASPQGMAQQEAPQQGTARQDAAKDGAAPAADASRRGPEAGEPRRSDTGGHFLFTANQGDTPEGVTPESEAPVRRDAPAAQQKAPTGEEATRFQQAPRLDRPAPPSPGGQPAQGARNAPPNGQGQAPPGLPKRPQRPDQGGLAGPPGGPDQAGRPPAGGPAQQGPGGERRPGPGGPGVAGPPRQGPPNGAPMNRPPQGGPAEPARPPQQQPPQPYPGGQQPAQQPAGPQQSAPQQSAPQQAPQQAGGQQAAPQQQGGQQQGGGQPQPLRGEPPLTLYRDRRHIMLQPDTDLDRFGDPSGNVAYAIRTPFTQRSLPPQWASRSYTAYRIQRPVQVLRGTAVPWFEQPGGGTAYVLPTSISELIADGTLYELSGNDAPPRPSME